MSQVSVFDVASNNPQIPTQFDADVGDATPIANVLNIVGDVVLAGTLPVGVDAVYTTGSGNTITTNVQISSAQATSDVLNLGLASFDSSSFTVDVNGFVQFSGGSFVSSITAGTNINITGTATNPIINLNDPVRQQNDSDTTPSYSFANGTGTGMYLNGDLRLGLSQGGTRFLLSDAFNTNFYSQIIANVKTFLVGVVNAYTTPGAYPYTVDNTADYYIGVNSSASAHTINFPNTTNTGHTWIVKDSTGSAATNNITVTTPAGTVLFDGSPTYVIDTNFGSIQLIFNGTNYEVF